MAFLAFLARLFFIRRLFGGRRSSGYGRRQPRGYGYGYGSRYGRRPPSGGFGMRGPFPTYSRRTRGGGRVSVSGCCLPIPLTLSLLLAGGISRLRRRG
jgi:hypothetical protein